MIKITFEQMMQEMKAAQAAYAKELAEYPEINKSACDQPGCGCAACHQAGCCG